MNYNQIVQQIVGPSTSGSGGGEFFVSSSGSGTGTGTQLDPFTGLQLKNLIDSGLPGIPPGSTIYFNKGDTFNYQYDLDDGDISFDAYGSGANPIISGSDDVGGQSWTLDSGNIYYTTLATEPKAVFVSGQEVKIAETAWIPIVGRPIQTQVTALKATLDALDGVEALEGAYILCKEWSFRPCLRRTVTDYTTGTPNGVLTLNAAPNTDATGAAAGMPFKLLNKKSFITEAGEWSFDSGAQRLYLRTSGSSPAGTDVRVSTRDYGINIATGLSNVNVTGITFKHQFLEGFYSVANHNVTIDTCSFTDLRTNAVSFTGDGTNCNVIDSTFARISNNAIHIGAIDGGEFSGNTFASIGVQSGVSIPQYSYFKSVGCGIHMRWDDTGTIWVPQNLIVRNNTFDNMGYLPVVCTGIGHLVELNSIDTFCITWNDGGGIYITNVYGVIYGHGSDTYNCTIQDNLIVNGVGGARTLEGVVGGTLTINGIYCDNNGHDYTIERNYIENINGVGVYVNVSNDSHYIGYNTIVKCSEGGVLFSRHNQAPAAVNLFPNTYGMTLEYNTFIGTTTSADFGIMLLVSAFDNGGAYNPFANGGYSNNNRFISPYRLRCVQMNDSGVTNYLLSEWQALFSQDADSTLDAASHLFVDSTKAAIDIYSGYNKTSSPTTLTPSSEYYYVDETGAHVTSVTIQPLSGRALSRQYFPVVSTLVVDTFTGSAGNLTGHTPDTGSAWTIRSGTFALDGSGRLTSSVAGTITQTGSSKNVELEMTGQVSATGGLAPVLRWISTTDRVGGQLLIDSTGGHDFVNVFDDGSTVQSLDLGTSLTVNIDYKFKVRLENGTFSVWVDDVLKIQIMDNASIRANNISTFVHGLFIPTTNKITSITIKEL